MLCFQLQQQVSHPDLRLGASPCCSVALYRASQAAAFLSGRAFVIPEDIHGIVGAVLGHRLILDVDRRLRGAGIEDVLADLVKSVPLPLADAS